MGLLTDPRIDFLNRIMQEVAHSSVAQTPSLQHVLVFVTPDIDGVCAWRILRVRNFSFACFSIYSDKCKLFIL